MYKITIRELTEGVRKHTLYKSGQENENIEEPITRSKVVYVQEFENLDMISLIAFINKGPTHD